LNAAGKPSPELKFVDLSEKPFKAVGSATASANSVGSEEGDSAGSGDKMTTALLEA